MKNFIYLFRRHRDHSKAGISLEGVVHAASLHRLNDLAGNSIAFLLAHRCQMILKSSIVVKKFEIRSFLNDYKIVEIEEPTL